MVNYEALTQDELIQLCIERGEKAKHLGREYGKASERIAELRGRIARMNEGSKEHDYTPAKPAPVAKEIRSWAKRKFNAGNK